MGISDIMTLLCIKLQQPKCIVDPRIKIINATKTVQTVHYLFAQHIAPQVKLPTTILRELTPTYTTRSLELANSPCSPFICYSKQAVIFLFSTYDDE